MYMYVCMYMCVCVCVCVVKIIVKCFIHITGHYMHHTMEVHMCTDKIVSICCPFGPLYGFGWYSVPGDLLLLDNICVQIKNLS